MRHAGHERRAGFAGRGHPRAARDEARDRRNRDVPAVEQRLHRLTKRPQLDAGEEEPDRLLVDHQTARGLQREVERLPAEPRHLGLVGDLECRVHARLQRELPQQREAECVDGGDLDVRDALAQLPPAQGEPRIATGPFPQGGQDPFAHLGRRLARERHGQHVRRIDTQPDQPDVPVDEDARLARTGRRLEHDVVAGIDREVPRGLVGRRIVERLVKQAWLHPAALPDTPSGTRPSTGTTGNPPREADWADIRPLRCARSPP